MPSGFARPSLVALRSAGQADTAARTFISYLTRPASKAKFAAAGLDYKE